MAGRKWDMMSDLIEVLAEGGYIVTFEPSLGNDLPIVLVTVKRGKDSYVARGSNSWKALERAVYQMPQSDAIFDAAQ